METKMSEVEAPSTSRVEIKTIPEQLRKYAEETPEENAFVFVLPDPYRREVISWGQLYKRSLQVAKGLRHFGVQRQDIVAVSMRNCPDWLYLTFGAMIAGAIPISISFTYPDGSDVINMMKKLEKCSVIAMEPGPDSKNWNILKKIVEEINPDGTVKSQSMPYLKNLILREHGQSSISGVKHFDAWLNEEHPDVTFYDQKPNTIAILFQTSGSTGIPKAVAHTYETLAHFTLLEELFGSDSGILMNDRPFGWVGGFPYNVLYGKKAIEISKMESPKDDISFLMEIIQTERIGICVMLPPVIDALMRRKDTLTNEWQLRTVATGGMPISKELTRCIGVLCKQMLIIYGSTESFFLSKNIVTSSESFTDNSSGKISKGVTIKIVNESGEVVPVNTPGEIWTKFPGVMLGYFNDKERTDKVKTADGWYRTGDIGLFSPDYQLFFQGRIDNQIICGGINLSPEVMETALTKCPFIESVILVPIPDQVLYQVVCACVIPKPGYDVTEEKLKQYCSDAINDKTCFVVPKHFMIMEKFPSTKTGKTSRPELTKMARLKFA